MYHRIDDPPVDAWGICVSAERFAEHMCTLSRAHMACRLTDVQQTSGRVAVTFDDGYADNLYTAKPILERYDIPATVFVISGSIGQRSFWWDELEHLFLLTAKLPGDPLILEVRGEEHRWTIEAGDLTLETDGPARHRRWIAWKDRPPTSRHATFYSVWSALRQLPTNERARQLEFIRQWADVLDHPNDVRPMTRPELQQISTTRLIDIGAHTVTHTRLSGLSLPDQRREITDCRESLAEALGEAPSSFSYPFGGPEDYTQDTIAALQDAGFERACSTRGGTVRSTIDPYQLPRAHVEDMNGDQFSRWLTEYLRH